MREDEKELEWLGNTLKFWQSVPSHARGEGGYQLQRVQLGFDPKNWRPMPQIGLGVAEIRIWDESKRTFRIIYTARFANKIYVLHAFEKKSQSTPKQDIDLAKKRFRELEGLNK